MKKSNYSAPQVSVRCVQTRKVVCQSPYGMEGEAGKEITETDGGSLFSLLLVGLLLLGGCAKSEAPQAKPEAEANQKIIINLTSEQSRTTVAYDSGSGKFKPSWTAGDRLGVFIHDGSQYVGAVKNKSTEALAAACEVASFSLESDSAIAKGTYDLYAYCPYSELDGDYNNAKVVIPTVQWPANGSFDPKADLLSARPEMVTIDNGKSTSVELSFARKTAIIRFLPSFAGEECYIESVNITMDKCICGEASWNIADNGELVIGGSPSNSVSVRYQSGSQRVTDPVWVSIAPVEGVTTMAFDIQIGAKDHLQAVATGLNKTFAEGSQTKFDLPINDKWRRGEFKKCYKRVTDVGEVTEGKYMIVATAQGTGYLNNETCQSNSPACCEIADGDPLWIDANEEWEIVPAGDSVQFRYQYGNGGYRYLYTEASVRVGGTLCNWKLTGHPDGGGCFMIERGNKSKCLGLMGNYWEADYATGDDFKEPNGTTKIKLYKRIN